LCWRILCNVNWITSTLWCLHSEYLIYFYISFFWIISLPQFSHSLVLYINVHWIMDVLYLRLAFLRRGRKVCKLMLFSKIMTINLACLSQLKFAFCYFIKRFNQRHWAKSWFNSNLLNVPTDNVCSYGDAKINKTTFREQCGNDPCRDVECPSELSTFRSELWQ